MMEAKRAAAAVKRGANDEGAEETALALAPVAAPSTLPGTPVCPRVLSPVSPKDSSSSMRTVRTEANRDSGRGRSRFVPLLHPQDGARVL